MNDSNKEFSNEERQRILKNAEDILNQIKNSGDNVTCGINKGIEKHKEHFEKNILMEQVILKAFDEALFVCKESPRHSMTFGDYIITANRTFCKHIYIQPAELVFFNSKLGNKQGIELRALTIRILVSFQGLKIKMEVISHFNPDIFNGAKIEYTGIIITGTKRHLEKEFDYNDINTIDNIKDLFNNCLTSIINFYMI